MACNTPQLFALRLPCHECICTADPRCAICELLVYGRAGETIGGSLDTAGTGWRSDSEQSLGSSERCEAGGEDWRAGFEMSGTG